MKKLLAVFAATVMFSASQVNADTLAPAPQIIAEYDRSFIERSGAQTFRELLDTGIIRYFFTGGRDLLVLVNGRPYAKTSGRPYATDENDLDAFPLSAVERIEVLRPESLGTFGGDAAVLGAINLVLREDLDGFDVRSVARIPSRDGGDAHQGSAVWGGTLGTDGHLTVSVDILNRKEIVGSAREHSRSEWTQGGSFTETKNVSVGGNTVYISDLSERKLRTVPLGDCDQALGYTGPLSNPPGITSGDKGCGFAYADIAWESPSYEQKNVILNLNYPLAEQTDLHVDASITKGRRMFRYAPSVDIFSITPSSNLLQAINVAASGADPTFETESTDEFSIGHRFLGHGNRDWRTNTEEYNFSASLKGRFTESLGYDAYITTNRFDGLVLGNTFVDAVTIREEIAAGRYDLANPLLESNKAAIEKSSLSEEEDFGSKFLGSRFALEGTGLSIGGRNTAWTAGVEFSNVEDHRLLAFRGNDGSTYDVSRVLGSGGTSYAGKRNSAGAFAEVSLPLTNSVDVRAAARVDDLSDVGMLRAWRLGAEYRLSDIVTLRGSWSAGDETPSMDSLYRFASQDHPYVLCIPQKGPEPRDCDRIEIRQVSRYTSGNPELKPSGSERHSIGIEARRGPFYFIADWYRLDTSDLPGHYTATWAILTFPECSTSDAPNRCIEFTAGDITIYDRVESLFNAEISGLNTRFGGRVETDWGFVAMRGFWRYVISSEQHDLPRNAVRIVTSVGRGDLTAFWALNYRDEISSGVGGFNSWTGHDVTLDWREPFGLENTRVTAGVYNVTDTKLSTHTANPSSTDGPRAAGWGRTFFVTLNLRF